MNTDDKILLNIGFDIFWKNHLKGKIRRFFNNENEPFFYWKGTKRGPNSTIAHIMKLYIIYIFWFYFN